MALLTSMLKTKLSNSKIISYSNNIEIDVKKINDNNNSGGKLQKKLSKSKLKIWLNLKNLTKIILYKPD